MGSGGTPIDVIAAPASAAGGVRGIIRLSGNEVASLLNAFLPDQFDWNQRRKPVRQEVQIKIADWPPLPAAIYFWPGRRSFTGEPLAEVHLNGAAPLIEAVLESLFGLGARPAEPGEFTLRAFLNGRIDLLQAEAVLGVIDASGQQQLDTALAQLAGGISTHMHLLREELLLHLADLEAGLDFVEEDIDFVHREELARRLEEVHRKLQELEAQSRSRMLSGSRPRVVLAGLPNAGKSSLFNALAVSSTAIVSPQAGTTRDYLIVPIRRDDVEFDLVDTAGWELSTGDELQRQMEWQRSDQYARADLLILCNEYGSHEQLPNAIRDTGVPFIEVQTKCDLKSTSDSDDQSELRVSSLTGQGLEELQAAITDRLRTLSDSRSTLLNSSAARCQLALSQGTTAALRALQLAQVSAGDELIAAELRDILTCLGEIVGEVYTDDILDRIFSRFCIGK